MKRPFRPFRPFRPSLESILEEESILPEIHGDIMHHSFHSKKMDFNKHREGLFGPHKYPFKHSRDNLTLRYSFDRTSVGLNTFIKQQREKNQYFLTRWGGDHEKKETCSKAECNTSIPHNQTVPSNPIWGQWSSPKRVITHGEINNEYGSRIKKWDSIQHKEDLVNNSLRPTVYNTRHAIGDKTKRLSYENSSEGFRAFLKSKKP